MRRGLMINKTVLQSKVVKVSFQTVLADGLSNVALYSQAARSPTYHQVYSYIGGTQSVHLWEFRNNTSRRSDRSVRLQHSVSEMDDDAPGDNYKGRMSP